MSLCVSCVYVCDRERRKESKKEKQRENDREQLNEREREREPRQDLNVKKNPEKPLPGTWEHSEE